MNNCKKCNNHKGQRPSNPQHPKASAIPMPKLPEMEIHVTELPDVDDSVTISLDEYTNLVAIATVMDMTIRWAKAHSQYDKIQFNELLLLLGANEEDAK